MGGDHRAQPRHSSQCIFTPPVCPSVYVASALAKADWVRTGWLAVKLGLSGFKLRQRRFDPETPDRDARGGTVPGAWCDG